VWLVELVSRLVPSPAVLIQTSLSIAVNSLLFFFLGFSMDLLDKDFYGSVLSSGFPVSVVVVAVMVSV